MCPQGRGPGTLDTARHFLPAARIDRPLTRTIRDVPRRVSTRATKDGFAMRILVTGGAGYVGSTLVPMLLEQGHRVRVLDSLKFGGHGLLPCCQNRHFELIKGDVCDEKAMAQALDGVEAVVHLAAIVGYPACKKEPHVANATNVEGTRTLLRLRK